MASLVALPAHAGHAPSQASALVWDMGEIYWDFGNQHIARGMTPDKVAALADKAAGKLASCRDELAQLLPGLDPKSRFAGDLRRLVERWPDRKAFREDLLRFYQGEVSAYLRTLAADPVR